MCSRVLVVGAVLGALCSLGAGSALASESLAGGLGVGPGVSFAEVVLSEPVTPTGTAVEIDIRPGSGNNPVNPKSNGVLPVAILSSETFDATQADPATIFLAGAPVASPSSSGKFLANEQDVNEDGLPDLFVKIETELIDLELLDLDSPTAAAILVGETFDGDPFWGADGVTIVPPDVANDSWALDAVAACIGSEIVSGYLDGLYHPETKVTRDQMAAFIARAVAGGDSAVPESDGTAEFSDVGEGSWAYDYVQYASAAGIVEGYGDGSYQPDAVVTRGQMAAFIARSMQASRGEGGPAACQTVETPSFSDVASDSWCYVYVQYLADQGIVTGYEDGTYQPDSEVTRDQMAVYIARAFGLTN